MRLMMIRVPIHVKDSGSLPWCLRNAQDNALLQLHRLLRPFSSHSRAGLSHEFGNEVARHQAPETRARKQTKNNSLSS